MIKKRYVIIVGLVFTPYFTEAAFKENIKQLYQNIGDKLSVIRRQFPQVRSHMFGIQDEVDRIYGITASVLRENEVLREEKKLLEGESQEKAYKADKKIAEKQEHIVLLMKERDGLLDKCKHQEEENKEILRLHQKLEESKEEMKEERVASQGLLKKDETYRTRQATFDEKIVAQSLNLTSSSEPSSPR